MNGFYLFDIEFLTAVFLHSGIFWIKVIVYGWKNGLSRFKNCDVSTQNHSEALELRKGKWYFSIVDIISALTQSINPTDYLKNWRKRDSELGNYIGTNCPQVEMVLHNGKIEEFWRNPEHLFRIIQSIPSKRPSR